MSTTRLSIMQQMAKSLGLYLNGTLTSTAAQASSGFVDTTKRYEGDDYLNEGFILTTGGTGSAQEHRVSDFANSTSTGTIYGTWATALDTTTTYDIYLPPITPDQYRAAIDAVRSKIVARGFARRGLDTTLVTTRSRRYTVPSTIDVSLATVYMQAREMIANNLWLDGSTNWTLHANGSLTNDGTNGERTLKLIATAAAERSYIEVSLSPLQELEFFATVKGSGAVSGRWQYQIYDTSDTIIVSYTTIGTAVLAATWTLENGIIKVPANAQTLRLSFDADGAGTVYSQAPQLMRLGDWERIGDWRPQYDGDTHYLELDGEPTRGRRLRITGRRALESLSADTSTLSLDEPELIVFLEMAMEEAWRQFGSVARIANATQDDEIAKHKQAWMDVIGGLSAPWKVRRTVRTPRFG